MASFHPQRLLGLFGREGEVTDLLAFLVEVTEAVAVRHATRSLVVPVTYHVRVDLHSARDVFFFFFSFFFSKRLRDTKAVHLDLQKEKEQRIAFTGQMCLLWSPAPKAAGWVGLALLGWNTLWQTETRAFWPVTPNTQRSVKQWEIHWSVGVVNGSGVNPVESYKEASEFPDTSGSDTEHHCCCQKTPQRTGKELKRSRDVASCMTISVCQWATRGGSTFLIHKTNKDTGQFHFWMFVDEHKTTQINMLTGQWSKSHTHTQWCFPLPFWTQRSLGKRDKFLLDENGVDLNACLQQCSGHFFQLYTDKVDQLKSSWCVVLCTERYYRIHKFDKKRWEGIGDEIKWLLVLSATFTFHSILRDFWVETIKARANKTKKS